MTDGLCSYPSLKLLNIDMLPVQYFGEHKTISSSLQQMVGQVADMINAAPSAVDNLVNEKISTLRREVYNPPGALNISLSKSTSAPNEQVNIQDFIGHKVIKINQNDAYRHVKSIKYAPVVGPTSQNMKIVETGISLRNSSPSDCKEVIPDSYKLIKTAGKRRSTVSKYNVVVSLQLNIGGKLLEGMNVVDLYQDVMFWRHSLRPIQASYCPYDIGIFGNILTQVSNSQAAVPMLDFLSNTAKMSYATNSNIHHYKEAGMEVEQLKDGLTRVQNIYRSYQMLIK